MALQDILTKYKKEIESRLEDELGRRISEVEEISPKLLTVVETMRELAAGGKRHRAILAILGNQLAGGKGEEEEAVKIGVILELFHLGLLIQDDVMDGDSLRRGVKTIHTRYENIHLGEAVANCAGDMTFGWGMEILSKLKAEAEKRNNVLAVWAKYFARVGYGQILDVVNTQEKMPSDEEVLRVLALKSGEYSCVLPLQMGAALAGADEVMMRWFYEYGMELGWVFQLRDDWLAEYGDSEKTGKPVGNDSREGKKTFATMYGREKLEAVMAEHLAKGKELARGKEVLVELLEWMATREN